MATGEIITPASFLSDMAAGFQSISPLSGAAMLNQQLLNLYATFDQERKDIAARKSDAQTEIDNTYSSLMDSASKFKENPQYLQEKSAYDQASAAAAAKEAARVAAIMEANRIAIEQANATDSRAIVTPLYGDPVTAGNYTVHLNGLNLYNTDLNDAKAALESSKSELNNANTMTDIETAYQKFQNASDRFKTISQIDPYTSPQYVDRDEVRQSNGVQYAAGWGSGGRLDLLEPAKIRVGNEIADSKKNETAIGNMIAQLQASGVRVTAEQMGDLAHTSAMTDTHIRELNTLNAASNYLKSPSDDTYTNYVNSYKDLATQPDYSNGINLTSLIGAQNPSPMKSLSSITLDTPLFANTSSKDEIEKGMQNATTNRQLAYWQNQADQLRENVIHSSGEYHGFTKQAGEKLDIPFPMNPFDPAEDVTLRQEQITRGISPSTLSFTQLPKLTDYTSALSSNQAEFNRQIAQNGIGAYGTFEDGTPKASWIAQAYSGPAGGKFINPSDVLANVPIQDYSQYLKSVNNSNIDSPISALITPQLPSSQQNLSGLPVPFISNPQSTQLSVLPFTFGAGSIISPFVGNVTAGNVTATNTNNGFNPFDFAKTALGAAINPYGTIDRFIGPAITSFNQKTGNPTLKESLNVGDMIWGIPSAIGNTFNPPSKNTISDYNTASNAYNSTVQARDSLWTNLKNAGKIDSNGVFTYDKTNSSDVAAAKSLEGYNAQIQGQYANLTNQSSQIQSLQKNESDNGIGGWWNQFNKNFSGHTDFMPDITGVSKNPVVKSGFSTIISGMNPAGKLVGQNDVASDVILPFSESVYMDTKKKPVEDVMLFALPGAFSAGEYGIKSGIAKIASSESPTVAKAGSLLSSNAVSDAGTLAKWGMGGLYAYSSGQHIIGDEKSDKSIAGYSSRAGDVGYELGAMGLGAHFAPGDFPAVDNPAAPKSFSALENARIFASSRLNTIGMDTGQKAAYLSEITPYKTTRFIEPYQTTEQPDLSHLTNAGKFAPEIQTAMKNTPHSMFGSGIVEAQKSNLPTADFLRTGKDVDLYTDPNQFIGNLARVSGGKIVESPGAESNIVKVGNHQIAVDPHNFPLNYPDIPGRTYGNIGNYPKNTQKGLGSLLFGAPVKSTPRPSEITMAGKTPDYTGELNFEHLNIQSAKKSQAVMDDILDPMNKGYRLDKDLYDSISIKRDLIATQRARGITPAENKNLVSAENSMKNLLDQTITYKNKSGNTATEKLGDIYSRVESDVINVKKNTSSSPIINILSPEVPSIGFAAQSAPVSGAGIIHSTVDNSNNISPIRPPDWVYDGYGIQDNADDGIPRNKIVPGGYMPFTDITPSIDTSLSSLSLGSIDTSKISDIIGTQTKGGITDLAHERPEMGIGGYRSGESITPKDTNEISSSISSFGSSSNLMMDDSLNAAINSNVRIAPLDESNAVYDVKSKGWQDVSHIPYAQGYGKISISPVSFTGSISSPSLAKTAISSPFSSQPSSGKPTSPGSTSVVKPYPTYTQPSKTSSPAVSPSPSPYFSFSPSPYTPSQYSPSLSKIKSPTYPSVPSGFFAPGAGGAGGGSRGFKAQTIIQNPLNPLTVASGFTAFKIQKGFQNATKTISIGNPIGNFIRKPTGNYIVNQKPVFNIRAQPRPQSRPIPRPQKQSPVVNFDFSGVFGSGKKRKKGMVF
jgi:hypothetical protein